MPLRAVVVALIVALLAAPLSAETLVERVLAVVDGHPIVLSDVRTLERLDEAPRGAALERMIDETLLFRESFRLRQAAVTDADERAAVPGLDLEHADSLMRRAAHRRAVIQKYAAFRFRPQVRVDADEVRRAYDAEWADRRDAPPFESLAETIRERLLTAAVQERVAAWLKELRASARVRYNPPD